MSARLFASFYVNDALCGTDILQIREVLERPEYSRVPQAPAIVEGLMNLRGQIVTVIDVARSLGVASTSPERARTCIILKTDGEMEGLRREGPPLERVGAETVGLLVDSMGEVLEIDDESIDVSPANTSQTDLEFIKGVAKLDKELMTILSLERVLEL
jgi:purine-binding chemotaxis protein CheW